MHYVVLYCVYVRSIHWMSSLLTSKSLGSLHVKHLLHRINHLRSAPVSKHPAKTGRMNGCHCCNNLDQGLLSNPNIKRSAEEFRRSMMCCSMNVGGKRCTKGSLQKWKPLTLSDATYATVYISALRFLFFFFPRKYTKTGCFR